MPRTVSPGSDNSIAAAGAPCSHAAVDLPAALAAFDEQMRRRPVPGPGMRIEDEVIAAQIARSTGSLEWKLYSHDRPADLAERLTVAGLRPEPVETVLVAEIADLDLPVAAPAGVRVVGVDDAAGVETMLQVHDAVFGPGTTHP